MDDSQILSALESKLGIVPAPGIPVIERVTSLELRLFRAEQSGSLADRIQQLSTARVPEKAPQESEPAKSQGEFLPFQNEYPPNFVRIVSPSEDQPDKDDYYPAVVEASQKKVFRFKTMPIPVFITPFPDNRFTRACIGGFESWEEGSDGLVRFTQVDDAPSARIKVVWSHLGIPRDKGGCALGAHTITKWNSKGGPSPLKAVGIPISLPHLGSKYDAKPQIIEVNLDLIYAREPDVRLVVLKNVVTHELGHALGILGHSANQSDMMYSVTDEYSRISQRDLNTLIKLYNCKPDVAL